MTLWTAIWTLLLALSQDMPTRVPIDFQLGSARIRPSSMPTVAAIAGALRVLDCERVEVRGHLGREEPPRSLDLSRARAEAVTAALVAHGVPQQRLVAHGYGATMPLVLVKTSADAAINRRLEIQLLHCTKLAIVP